MHKIYKLLTALCAISYTVSCLARPLNISQITLTSRLGENKAVIIGALGGSQSYTITFNEQTITTGSASAIFPYPVMVGLYPFSIADGTTTLSGTINLQNISTDGRQIVIAGCDALGVEGIDTRSTPSFYRLLDPLGTCLTEPCITPFEQNYSDVFPAQHAGTYLFTQNENTISLPFTLPFLDITAHALPACVGNSGSVFVQFTKNGVTNFEATLSDEIGTIATLSTSNGDFTITGDRVSGNFTDIPQGIYSLTVTDRDLFGCSINYLHNPVIVDEGVPASINDVVPVAPTCTETRGSISFTITEGIPPYTALLSGGATIQPLVLTNIPEGETRTFDNLEASPDPYFIEAIYAGSCSSTSSAITLSPPEQLGYTLSTTAPSCFGGKNGTITVTIDQAAAPSKVKIQDNNGQVIRRFDAIENGIPTTSDNLFAGMYTVTIIDIAGCVATQLVTIANGEQLEITSLKYTPIMSKDDRSKVSFTVSGGTAPYTFWLFRGKELFTVKTGKKSSGHHLQTIKCVPAGHYTLIVADKHGCITQTGLTICDSKS